MRKLFFISTSLFWSAVLAIAYAGQTAPTVAAPATKAETGQAAAAAEQKITLAEVARHATETDCWMAIGGGVYDLSSYLPDHPSRPSLILPWCGKEATEAYKTKTKGRPHSPEADQLLPRYRIGVLAP